MTKHTAAPEPVAAYLRQVRHELAGFPARYRDEVLSTLAEHANDRLAAGDDPDTVVASLGDPGTVAAQAAEQFPEGDRHTRWLTPRRVGQLVAVALALVAAVYVLVLLPAYTQVTMTNSDGSVTYGRDGSMQIETNGGGDVVVETGTVLGVVGPLAILGAATPVLLTGIPLVARGRAGRPVAVACAALLTVFAVIASATIGWFFLPACVAALVALFLPDRAAAGVSHRMRAGLS